MGMSRRGAIPRFVEGPEVARPPAPPQSYTQETIMPDDRERNTYETSGTCPNCLHATRQIRDAQTHAILSETCGCYHGAVPRYIPQSCAK